MWKDAKLTLIEQLRFLGGVESTVSRFELVVEGRRVTVHHVGGSSASLSLAVPYPTEGGELAAGAGYRAPARPFAAPRPMKITLRAETKRDRRAKASGVASEVQLGDPAFDEQIYVDTASDEATVKHVLASPDARAAALTLVGLATSVLVDDDAHQITVDVIEFSRLDPDQDRGQRLVAALHQLASALPAVAPTGETLRDPWKRPIAVAVPAAMFGMLALRSAYQSFSPAGCYRGEDGLTCGGGPACCGPIEAGALATLALGALLFVLAPRFIRGRSSSHVTLRTVRVVGALLIFEVATLLARLIWRRAP